MIMLMPGATVLINSSLSPLNQNQLESQLNNMLSPDLNGNISFNLNSISEMFTNSFSGTSTNNNLTFSETYSEGDFENNILNIKKCFYMVLISLVIMTLLYIFKSRDVFYDIITQGFFITSFKYPVMPIISLLFHLSLIIYFMYKLFHRSLKKLSKNFQTKKESEKNTQHPKSTWKNITDICQSNLDHLVNEIYNGFQNTDIANHFNNPIDKKVEKGEEKREIINEISKKYKINLDLWKKINHEFKDKFCQVYKKFKEKEKILLEIKNKLTDINEWSLKTESLLNKYNDKSDVEKIVKKYIKNKINDLDYPKVVKEYQESYLDLSALLKYMSHNYQIENISKCPVCLTDVKNSFYVSCGHCFCKSCIDEQYKINKKYICPICRKESTKIGKLFS